MRFSIWASLAAGTSCVIVATATAGVSISHTFDFDAFAPGAQANSFPQPPGLGASFWNAVYAPDLDPFGAPIPGTERWRVDETAPPVIVDDPLVYGRGAAPSVPNALEALFQPVLINLETPFNLDTNGFSAVLDNDTFGFNGFLPGFHDIAVLFLDPFGVELGRLQVNQTQPGFVVSGGGLQNVASILLPGGAFYDNIFISGVAVPTPGAVALLGLAGLVGVRRRR